MKSSLSLFGVSLFLCNALAAADALRSASTIVLDEMGVQNLGIETAIAEPAVFEETIFALGRIEAIPRRVAAVSSRIPGRIVALGAQPGERLNAGAEVAKVESRQPGNPPSVISLTAPLAGLVTTVDVRLGDPVEPDRALLEIADLSEVFAVARLPEHSAGRIESGAIARIRVAALPDANLEGRFVRFGTTADEVSGTIDAYFLLENPDSLIRPGMRAEFSVIVGRRSDVVSVPRTAIQGDPSNRFVFVRDFDLPNAFVKTPVVVGQTNDRFAEIIRGLLPADEVVTEGAYSLSFAGGGSISLKEALDAAHGHEHNPDGSEITPDQKSAAATLAGQPQDNSSRDLFWKIVSGILFALLLVIGFRRKPAGAATPDPRGN